MTFLGGCDVDLLRLARDLLDGAHKDVGHDAHAEEGVEEPDQVDDGSRCRGPCHFQKDGKEQALLGTLVLGPAPTVRPEGVAQRGLVARPKALRVVHRHPLAACFSSRSSSSSSFRFTQSLCSLHLR